MSIRASAGFNPSGPVVVSGPVGATGLVQLTDTGANGVNLKMTGNGGTTPSKVIRVNSGAYEIVNDAYSAVIMRVSDTGLISTNAVAPLVNASGSLGAPNIGWTKLYIDFTNTGTVGAVTINKAAGRVNIAAAGTSVVVTNSFVTAASHVLAIMSSADATGRVISVVPAAGSFTLNTVATTAQSSFDFFVINAD